MTDFIAALEIFKKYASNPNDYSPFHCEHDILMVGGIGVDWNDISEEDRQELERLGFFNSTEHGYISSYRFGSC